MPRGKSKTPMIRLASSPPPVCVDSHIHTVFCGHAFGLIEDYAEEAVVRGVQGLMITCHNPMPPGYSPQVRMAQNQFDLYLEFIAEARDEWAGRVDIRPGLECDFVPACVPWLSEFLQHTQLDYVLGSVHPQLNAWLEGCPATDPVSQQRHYFDLLGAAAESRLFDALAHPDIIKNVFPYSWQLPRIMDDVRRCLDRVAATGVALEVNTSGFRKNPGELNPGPDVLVEMKARGIPVVLGSDAHTPDRVGEGFEAALSLLLQAGYQEVSVFNKRQRQTRPIAAVLGTLTRPRSLLGTPSPVEE